MMKINLEWHEKILADGWKEVTDQQRDGELYLLLIIDHEALAFDDSSISRVIGFNQYHYTEDDKWRLCGWDWCQDYFLDISSYSFVPLYYKELPKGLNISANELFKGVGL